MLPTEEDEFAALAREIAIKQLDVENQSVLIEVLERDGHDMFEQRKKLDDDRSDLARQIEKRHRLLDDKVNAADRRKQERIDVDEVGYISGDGSSLRCRVINMSAHGASIILPSKLYVNNTFKLMLERDRVIRNCRLVWSKGDQIGVSFADPS